MEEPTRKPGRKSMFGNGEEKMQERRANTGLDVYTENQLREILEAMQAVPVGT